jgi:hypothetical protein
MVTETKKSWKVWIYFAGVAMLGIGGCTVKLMTGGNPVEAIQEGTSTVKQGYDATKSGEIPTK